MVFSLQDNGGVSRPTVDNSINTINTSRLVGFAVSWFPSFLMGWFSLWLFGWFVCWLTASNCRCSCFLNRKSHKSLQLRSVQIQKGLPWKAAVCSEQVNQFDFSGKPLKKEFGSKSEKWFIFLHTFLLMPPNGNCFTPI